uniref:Uncharacterized protein n=1 Tax=Glossina pallidipes TaxID=7398 RepID=A0A1B0A195_GLOPL
MPKKKKPKVNLHHRSFSKSCLSTDELAVIIRGPNRRQTLKESELYSTSLISNSINTAGREPMLKAKSSLNLNLSTSPSSGIYSGASSYASSLQARSSSSSSSSIESLNSSYCHTPISSNASTPLSLPSGNPVWPLSLGIPHELAVLRTRISSEIFAACCASKLCYDKDHQYCLLQHSTPPCHNSTNLSVLIPEFILPKRIYSSTKK